MRKNHLFFTLFEEVLFLEFLDDYAGFLKKLHGKLVGVWVFVHNPFYAAVYDDTGADGAGLMRAIKRCAVNRNAEPCRLCDCVLLCVHGIALFRTSAALYAELVAHAIAFVAASEDAGGRAVVARCQNAFVLDYNRAYGSALTSATCPGGNEFRHIHKSFVPFVHSTTTLNFIINR
jgi:hypothetical protein